MKRAVAGRALNLYVEYLVVIDSTVYNDYAAIYTNMSQALLSQYISIFFCLMVNGVSTYNFIKKKLFYLKK